MYLIITNKKDDDWIGSFLDLINSFENKSIKLKPGLNIGQFNINSIKLLKNLHNLHYDNMYYIRPVIIMNNNNNIKKVRHRFQSETQIDKIILGNRYCLYDPKTIIKFKLIINEYYIKRLCIYGNVMTLDWLLNNNSYLKCSKYQPICDNITYSVSISTYASIYGNPNVLEWWLCSGLPLEYTKMAIHNASIRGHINVLSWWKHSGLPLKYGVDALDYASNNGHIHVLEWWKQSGLELKYSENALESAAHNGYVNVLEWWEKSGSELKYHHTGILANLIRINQVDVFNWIKKLGLPLDYQ
jgi:hypothetical protein